ncbi:molybdopterin-dependent oxidoreductase [Sphingobium sp. WCS2017Hpa-17]|uniref:molybdopterin-dependent oxidoreductase n=1 Tax=Sphingobium sp. WCS2017Hpa-17 TaxID=3073638 RepID=UPI00288BC3AD|nr:molybdopterin-dependent oxidoreductase [Sphingobium sp. WCS2017Hpa-17]
MTIIRSQCGQCSVGCGVRAVVRDGRDLVIEGDRVHPVNGGRLCARGRGLNETALDGRLLHPMLGSRQVGWDRAIAHAARKLTAIMTRHGPGSIALHVSGGLLTEDYYVANKLMKGFFGSAHIHVSGGGPTDLAAIQQAAFGEDVMPAAIEDIERAQTVLLVGGRIGQDHPVLLERVQAAREEQRLRLVLLTDGEDGGDVDADLRLSVTPGSVDLLLTGALLHCRNMGGCDGQAVASDVTWAAIAEGHDLWSIARLSGLSPATIRAFYEEVMATDRLVTLVGSHAGQRAAAAACNLHVATGRIARPGSTPFLLTGSANGMGAREVGCAAGHLAAHRFFTPDALDDVGRFWGARRLADGPGHEGDALLEAIRDGRIKALWSIGPDAAADSWLREARAAVPFALCSTVWARGVEDFDILFPAPVWVEKDGTVTASDRLISRQRRLLPLPGDARPDWWIFTKLAQTMGWGDAFHYERPADIYREHVRLTAYRNQGDRLLNLKRHAPISNPAYDELTPWRWGDVPFDGGHFPTTDGRARLLWPLDQDFSAIS